MEFVIIAELPPDASGHARKESTTSFEPTAASVTSDAGCLFSFVLLIFQQVYIS